MRILFIIPSLVMGGLERTQVTIANSLCHAGHDVTVMLLDKGDELSRDLNRRVTLQRKPYKEHFGQRIPYIRHKFYDDGMWEKRATPAELYRYYVGDERFDVEIAYFHGLSVKIISGSTNENAVHMTWIHNDFKKIRGYQLNFKSLQAVQEAYRTFDWVVAVSEQARRSYIEVIGDTGNTVTVYNMIPCESVTQQSRVPMSLPYPEKGLRLVIVGRLIDSHKGHLRLISAVTRLKNEGVDLSLCIVGDGADREKIAAAIRESQAENYIFMEGNQKNPFPYIIQADALVCASYYEGYNLTVAEAVYLEKPVLSTMCTGPCEILDNGRYGMLVENSEEGLYEGIRRLAEEPELLAEYSRKAAQRKPFFSEERLLNQITALFEKPSGSNAKTKRHSEGE